MFIGCDLQRRYFTLKALMRQNEFGVRVRINGNNVQTLNNSSPSFEINRIGKENGKRGLKSGKQK